MLQQPYFPEPIEVPGNVASQKYGERVSFLRRVQLGYAFSVAVAVGLALPDLGGTWQEWAGAALALMIGLTLVRRAAAGRRWDTPVSLLLLAPTLLAIGQAARVLYAHGWPVTVIPLATALALAYTLLCGRDYSSVGQYFLALGALAVLVALADRQGALPVGTAFFGFAGGAVFLLYLVYDLSMIARRRRPDETAAGVADLYRDTLNLATYPVRVALHWRKFRFISFP